MGLSILRGRLGVIRDGFRTQLWPLPTLFVVLGLALGVAVPQVDGHVDRYLPGWVVGYLFGGGPDSARTVLSAVSSSLITVTSLTFSLTVVTLQLASSQFSPRLLRTFTRDRFVHVTLGLFLATFTYALTVLRSVRTASADASEFVPQISVTFAFVMGVASVIALVLFLAHLATEIRVETMLRNVHRDASQSIDAAIQSDDRTGPSHLVAPSPPSDAHLLLGRESGVLVNVDEAALCRLGAELDLVVFITAQPGASCIEGTPVAVTWRRDGARLGGDALDRVGAAVNDALTVAAERTAVQDIGFGLRQLADVATKALSPGINDPTTAITALGHSSALLVRLATCGLGNRVVADDQGTPRVVMARPDLAEMLAVVVDQPRRYGIAEPDVMARILGLLRELAWVTVDADQRRAVRAQLDRQRDFMAAQGYDDAERAELAELTELVTQALNGKWPAVPVRP